MDWITGEKFAEVADLIFMPKVKAKDDYYNLPNTFNLHKLNNNSIIYTHTMYVKELFSMLDIYTHGNIIVITHNSDVNVDDSFEIPNCVKKWFTTNVNTINSKIESIPIGLENDRWFPKLRKKEVMLGQTLQKRDYKNLVYMNHNIKTNPSIRNMPYNVLKNKSWVTAEFGVNGQDFPRYASNIYNHKFIVCPEGNGIDTHRLWETLYMGSIPIVKENTNYSFYSDLPIYIVTKWDELTERGLNLVFDSIKNRKNYNLEKLTFEYWKNKISQS